MSTKDINYYQEKIKRVNKIGVMISKEKDIDKLMNWILEESVLLTNSDAGSIYFKEKINNKDYLVFKHSVNRSSNLNYKGESIAINEQSVSGLAALNGETIIVKKDNLSEYPVDTSFDKENNYYLDFENIDMNFYYAFVSFLEEKKLSKTGITLETLLQVLALVYELQLSLQYFVLFATWF